MDDHYACGSIDLGYIRAPNEELRQSFDDYDVSGAVSAEVECLRNKNSWYKKKFKNYSVKRQEIEKYSFQFRW